MTEKVQRMLDVLWSGEYKRRRRDGFDISALAQGKDAHERETLRFEEMLKAEEPYFLDGDIFGFNRTVKERPVFSLSDGTRSEPWVEGNITPNYIRAIDKGFLAVLEDIADCKDPADGRKFAYCAILERHIRAVLALCERYREAAEREGRSALAKALARVPRYGARTLYEALVFQKIIVFMLRCAGCCHLTFGRFDQYMFKFYRHDIENGASKDALLELIELYFISLNLDTDLYQGVQVGDNGQSMVLGGYDLEGRDMYNELSELCMEASLALNLIDPKINLRVSKKTPIERYEYATKLTKRGLGFPQYSNDDIVVPGLVSMGYDLSDAVDYTIAACWEFIVPNCSRDLPNETTFNMPVVVNDAIHKNLAQCGTFEALMETVFAEIDAEVMRIVPGKRTIDFSPCLSLFVDGCAERGLDLCDLAAKYNNSGCHCVGISNAADALMAVRQTVYEEKSVTPQALLSALDSDFAGNAELQNKLLSCPKMGNNIDAVDEIACALMERFATQLNGRPNNRGGIWRAGTGSAHEYIYSAEKCPATADGKNAKQPYGSSFSPALTTKLNGPLSVIQSFTKFDLKKIINGGPLTMELHDTVFRNEQGEKKVAQLVKLFIDRGGHQLQLNSVNRERLLAAQQNPEADKNLIVRVWGWSGFFCELEKKFQDHIIARTEFQC